MSVGTEPWLSYTFTVIAAPLGLPVSWMLSSSRTLTLPVFDSMRSIQTVNGP